MYLKFCEHLKLLAIKYVTNDTVWIRLVLNALLVLLFELLSIFSFTFYSIYNMPSKFSFSPLVFIY